MPVLTVFVAARAAAKWLPDSLQSISRQALPEGWQLQVRLGIEQPSVSKHLGVLRNVGLVRARRHGRQMLYQTNGDAIRPLYEWTRTFERLWAHQLLRIKERAEQKEKDEDNR